MIRFVIKLYILLLLLDAILSFFPETEKYEWRHKLRKLCNYTCDPIRKYLPRTLPFDISPMLVIFLLTVFMEVFDYLW